MKKEMSKKDIQESIAFCALAQFVTGDCKGVLEDMDEKFVYHDFFLPEYGCAIDVVADMLYEASMKLAESAMGTSQ